MPPIKRTWFKARNQPVLTPEQEARNRAAQKARLDAERVEYSPVTRFSAITVIVLALVGGLIRHAVSTFPRTNFHELEYFEDSKQADGTRYRVVQAANTTGHAYFTIEAMIRPTATATSFHPSRVGSLPLHAHPAQTEEISVKDGVLGYEIDGVPHTAKAGDSVRIEAGQMHTLWNADLRRPVKYQETFTPAGAGEQVYENVAGYLLDDLGVARVPTLQWYVWFKASDIIPGFMSAELWQFIRTYVTPVAELAGYSAFHQEYHSHGPYVTQRAAKAGAKAVDA